MKYLSICLLLIVLGCNGPYNEQGFNIEGYNAWGYNASGYNSKGYDKHGYNIYGHNKKGLTRQEQAQTDANFWRGLATRLGAAGRGVQNAYDEHDDFQMRQLQKYHYSQPYRDSSGVWMLPPPQ